jgi:cell division protein FtsA
MGGQDITMEISRRLGIDQWQAEQLKMQYQSGYSHYGDRSNREEDKIIIKKSSSVYESITRKDLTQIIDKKLGQLISMIKTDLELAGIISRTGSRIVVCGGMSFMDGIIERLESVMGLPVKLGIMRGFVSNLSGLSNIFYATSIGLVMHILNEQKDDYRAFMRGKGVLGQVVSKIRSVYEEYF